MTELLIERDGSVVVVTLNRPEALNAANAALHGRLARIWGELDADPEIRAIVLTGSGDAFCAGGDLKLLDAMTNDLEVRTAIMAEASEIVTAMTSVRVPIIAAVNGAAVGLGCSLAGMSDIVLVEEQAFLADPHVALGLVAADGGALTWPMLTSLMKAKEYLLLGDRLPAAEAVAIGLANRVVPTGQARTEAVALAHRIAKLPAQSVSQTKAALNSAVQAAVASILPKAIVAERASFDEPEFRANLARMLERSRR
jgi:enoyl-CoA hydratase